MSQQAAWGRLTRLEGERSEMLEANSQGYTLTGKQYTAHSPKALRSITRLIAQARCDAQGVEYR